MGQVNFSLLSKGRHALELYKSPDDCASFVPRPRVVDGSVLVSNLQRRCAACSQRLRRSPHTSCFFERPHALSAPSDHRNRGRRSDVHLVACVWMMLAVTVGYDGSVADARWLVCYAQSLANHGARVAVDKADASDRGL